MPESRRKREFTIDRRGTVERTIVGTTGLQHVDESPNGRHGRDGHFAEHQEGEYRRAIEKAVRDNTGT